MVNSHRFGSGTPPPSDISFAVQDIATGTATGSTSYTSATITGLTPAATLLMGSIHAIANDPGETPTASMTWGIIQDTLDYNLTNKSADNVASTDNVRDSSSVSFPYYLFDAGGSGVEIATGANISGGLSLNYSTNDATDRRAMSVSFAGSNVSAKAGIIPLGTGTTAITVSGVGFQPDAIILLGNNDDMDTGTAIFQCTFGVATADGTQRSVSWRELHAATSGAPSQNISTTAGAGQNSGGGTASEIVIGGFGADGFTATPSASQGSDDLLYLALKFTGGACKIVDLTTPTSTGSSTISGAGFTPRFALVVITNLEAVDSVAGTTSDLQSGLGISFVGDEQWATSWRIDSGADPTDTASQCSNAAIMGPSATDCDAILASFTAWTSDGMTVNYSAVQGTAKKGFVLFIE